MKKSLSRRITAYFLIIMVLTLTISSVWNYFSTRRAIIDTERTQAEGCSQAVRSLVEHYGAFLDAGQDSEGYLYLRNATNNFRIGFHQDALTLYSIDAGTGDVRILLQVSNAGAGDSASDADLDPFVVEGFGMSEPEQALYSGADRFRRVEWRSGGGRRATWITLLTEPGAPEPLFLSMEYSVGMEDGRILSDFLADILVPSIALGAAFLVMMLMIRKRVITPIRLISDSMKRFARNSKELPEPLAIRNDDEIGEIAFSFESMTKEITSSIQNIEALTRERVALNVQMDVARRIQNGLVPEKTVLNGASFAACAMTRPAKAVGGDFYDCFRMDDGKVCVLMGDVSGKSITGAIFMAVIKTVIREKLMLGLSPAQALSRTNEELLAQNPEGLFATVFVAILDPVSGDMRYANAGHTWPVLLGEGVQVLHPETGIALGLFEDADIQDETMTLSPGQGLFLYTDGLTDALNAQRAPFGMNRLLETLRNAPPGPAPEELLLLVSRDVGGYCQGVEPFDDMAVLILFFTGNPCPGEAVSLPVAVSSLSTVKEAILALTGVTPQAKTALLACDETLSNIVNYSGAARLLFRCGQRGDVLRVVFEDDGVPFDPTAAAAAEKEFEQLDSGGMGLKLIRNIAASTHYARRDSMNVFTMDFSL